MTKIISAPNPVLSAVAKKYPFTKDPKNDKALGKLLSDMEYALLNASDPKGVGLAAPQIGLSFAIFIAKPTNKSKISVFINPKILDTKTPNNPNFPNRPRNKKPKRLEGCLSLPTIWGEVKRLDSVTLQYFNETGKKRLKTFRGFMATIVQHEVDHLNGILFPKRVLEQKGQLYQSKKDEKGEDIFEEITI
ncbi:MAG: peptide deformylase [Candidatus Levybacteria bacterium]|nr:peptide deformylase [Candidatus Levybacteria bacterium]